LFLNPVFGFAASLDLTTLHGIEPEKYKAGVYACAAEKLQAAGRESACRALLRAAHEGPNSRQIIVLCRMLFTKRADCQFSGPMLGRAGFLGGTGYPDWPLEPIELVNGVPFLITRGYSLFGQAETPEAYLRYCIANCDWSAIRFRKPTGKQRRYALAKLLASVKWKHPLNPCERGFLSAQIEQDEGMHNHRINPAKRKGASFF
jgi:hypothetical protein